MRLSSGRPSTSCINPTVRRFSKASSCRRSRPRTRRQMATDRREVAPQRVGLYSGTGTGGPGASSLPASTGTTTAASKIRLGNDRVCAPPGPCNRAVFHPANAYPLSPSRCSTVVLASHPGWPGPTARVIIAVRRVESLPGAPPPESKAAGPSPGRDGG